MRIITSEENMKSKLFRSSVVTAFVLLLIACAMPVAVAAQTKTATPATTQGPKAFDTPQQAAEALIKAAGDYDVPELMAIFGPDGEDFISGGDQVRDKNNGIDFAKEASAKNSIVMSTSKLNQVVVVGQHGTDSTTMDASKANRATIIVGDEEWPFPVPLVKKNGKWYFNAKEGREEILYRRIGANELDAITVCRGYVEAQKEYSSADPRRLRCEPVRAEDYQHAWKAGWPILEER